MKKLCWILALIFLVFTVLPLFYGIFNVGSMVLLGLAIFAFLFPFILDFAKDKKALRITILLITGIGIMSFSFISILMVGQAYFKKAPSQGRYTVIVLGAKVVQDYPSLTLRRRLDKAVEYLLENPEADCIVSGGQGEDELYPEGQIMKEYLVKRGIDPDRIQSEEKSVNTRENLRLSKELIKEDSRGIVIATDNFHQLRASITAEALGLNPIYAVSSWTVPALLPAYWVRDLCGVPLTLIEEYIVNK